MLLWVTNSLKAVRAIQFPQPHRLFVAQFILASYAYAEGL
jgi:hypothetical protein